MTAPSFSCHPQVTPTRVTLLTIITDAAKHAHLVLNGTVLAIDPASGASSACAAAYFLKGEMQWCATVPVESKAPVGTRLRQLFANLSRTVAVDVLVIERIRGTRAHTYLHWSVGVAVASVRHTVLLEMPVSSWHKHVRFNSSDYEKSDKNDATAIGRTLIHLAKGLPL